MSDSKPEAPPEKPPEAPETSPIAIPSVLSNDHSLGAIITMAREARGFSREQAATSSNIPGYYLTMIETDDYSSIADQLYLLPFLRRYAIFVGLEAEEVASRFIRDVQRADMNPGRPSEPITMFEPRKPLPWRLITTIVVAIAVSASTWFGYRYYEEHKAAMANSASPAPSPSVVPDAEQAAPEAADTAPANVAPASPVSAPSMAVLPDAVPSVVAAPAAIASAAPSPEAAASAAIAPTVIPHIAAPPPAKPAVKSPSRSTSHLHGTIKSPSTARRLSMQD